MKSRVFITGDVHCPHDIHKLNSKNFPTGNTLNKNDILIICGDAGFVWSGDSNDKWWIDWISRKPWTTVYVPGNHENYDLLDKYPVVDFHGAKAHKISDSLYQILRGEIMDINDEKYFCFGGAFSHDREYRTENISWWQAELPVQSEVDNALNNLEKVHNKVDYIVTHDVPSRINHILGYNKPSMQNYDAGYIHICQFLQNIMDTVDYNVWFAGHYHTNRKIDDVQILYEDIVEIKSNEDGSYYRLLEDNIKNILSRKFSEKEIIEIAKKEKLCISRRKIDTYEHFGLNEYIYTLEDYCKAGLTNLEIEQISYLYNIYTIKKDTMDE